MPDLLAADLSLFATHLASVPTHMHPHIHTYTHMHTHTQMHPKIEMTEDDGFGIAVVSDDN